MNWRKRKRIEQIESEYGVSFEDLLKDFSRDCSYTFTCNALGLAPDKWREYQGLFQRYKFGERPHVAERNRTLAQTHNGMTVTEMVEKSGLSRGTIKSRIARGTPAHKLMDPPVKPGNTDNFKGRHVRDQWRDFKFGKNV